MKRPRVARIVLIAATVAALCSVFLFHGAWFVSAIGILALVLATRLRNADGSPSVGDESDFSEYGPWLLCTGSFAGFTICFVPLTFGGATLALLFLAPYFGTMTYLIDVAVARLVKIDLR